ncbi:hypothetical protein PQR02_29790 [Paraburkholderia sediminicola]|uniref:Uncharacterized protein n=1 Tax=Paraburkholderia rhynchosiae TaxID=487049 RepID=A0ACC7NL49_9BURK
MNMLCYFIADDSFECSVGIYRLDCINRDLITAFDPDVIPDRIDTMVDIIPGWHASTWPARTWQRSPYFIQFCRRRSMCDIYSSN